MSQPRNVRCSACGETYQIPEGEDRCRLCGETGKLRYLNPAPASAYAAEPMEVEEVQEIGESPRPVGSVNFMAIFGTIITIIGVILFIGNITRLLPTFPAAGYLTIVIGGAIAGAGKARQRKGHELTK